MHSFNALPSFIRISYIKCINVQFFRWKYLFFFLFNTFIEYSYFNNILFFIKEMCVWVLWNLKFTKIFNNKFILLICLLDKQIWRKMSILVISCSFRWYFYIISTSFFGKFYMSVFHSVQRLTVRKPGCHFWEFIKLSCY